jgi:ketopantoate hydroxymethyltransferase
MHDAFGITGGIFLNLPKISSPKRATWRAAVRQYIADVESGVYRVKNTVSIKESRCANH